MSNKNTKHIDEKVSSVKQVNRLPWKEKHAKRSIVPAIFTVIQLQIGLFVLFIISIFLFSILPSFEITFASSVIFALIIVVDLLFSFYIILYAKSFEFILTPGSFDVVQEFIDTTVGSVVISYGVFFKVQRYYPVDQFQRVSFTKSFMGQQFNFGSVILHQTNKDDKDVVLSFIVDPERFAGYIEQTILAAKGMKLMDAGLTSSEPTQVIG